MADNKVEIEIIATGLEETKKRIEELTAKLGKLADNADNAKKRMKLLGEIQKQFTILRATVGGFGAVATKMALDFNKSFGTVETLIGTNAEKTKKYKQDILDLSNTYGKSAKDLADGMYQIVSAFGESTENAKQLEIATKGAVAGGATAIESINLLSAVTKGYGDTSAEALQKVSDLSFQVVKDGQTSFPELAGSIGRVVPTASALGISMEELMTVFSTSTGVIGGASEVSTKFQAGLVGLTKPTKELSDLYAQLGIASGDALIKQKGFVGALNEIKKGADKNGKSIDKYFGSIEAGNIALALTGNLSDQFAQKLENMNGALGATDQAYKDFTEGSNSLAFNMEKAGTQLQNFGIAIGAELIPKLNSALTSVFGFIDGLASMDRETVALIVDIGEILAVVAGMTVAVTTAQKAFMALTLAKNAMGVATVALMIKQKALNAVMAINPFGLAVIGLTAMVAILPKVSKYLQLITKNWKDQNSIAGKVASAYKDQKEASQKLGTEIEDLWKKENKSADEKQRMYDKIEDLKKAIPSLTQNIIDEALAQGTLNETIEHYLKLEADRARLKGIKVNLDLFSSSSSKNIGKSGEETLKAIQDFQKKIAPLSKETQELLAQAFTIGRTDYNTRKKAIEEARKEGVEILEGEIVELGVAVGKIAESAVSGEGFDKVKNVFGAWFKGDFLLDEMRGNEFAMLDALYQMIIGGVEKLETDIADAEEIKVVPKVVVTPEGTVETDKVEDAIKDAKKRIEDSFTSIDIGDDPWGIQKVLDTTGELGYSIQSLHELQEAFKKAGGESTEAGKKIKEAMEETVKSISVMAIGLAGAVASSANDIFASFSEAQGKAYLDNLDRLLADVNERLAEYQEERRAEEERIREELESEEEARDEEKRQKEYEKALQDLDRSIGNLQAQYNASTSVKKRAELAEQMEELNKKKAEEKRRREEEREEKERQKKEEQEAKDRQKAEMEMLYQFELEKYNLEVDRIRKENQLAESEKAQRIAQVWIDSATGIATSWALNGANLATMWYPAVFTATMLGIAGAQTSAIAGQNVQKPIPSAPKPPKLHDGGIVGNHGENGKQVIVGDNVREGIIPLTPEVLKDVGAGAVEAFLAKFDPSEILNTMKTQNQERQQSQQAINIAKIENTYNNSQNIVVNQTNTMPYTSNASISDPNEQETWTKVALKVCDEIKNSLEAGQAFDDTLMSRSRGVHNAWKDQE